MVDPDPVESKRDHDMEEPPIVRRRLPVERVKKPCGQRVAVLRRQGIPERLGRQSEREADRRALDDALVAVAREPPVIRMVRIRAVCETLDIEANIVERAAARHQRREPPERPRQALEIGRRLVEMRSGRAQTKAPPSGVFRFAAAARIDSPSSTSWRP